ncbi:unnamed protein product [Anisakis simplex]|uniref:Muscular LMNA-interacting protein n=1 Tax=Anisakis simplex TaxID=6269 RepID=A0A0M3K6F7_ANISI|nr:unnamed protein product [Anisakis simplex]
MEEHLLRAPEPRRVEKHFENEISTASQPDTIKSTTPQPQRAQIAYYRPFIPDPMDETILPEPERKTASYHDISELCGLSKQPSVSTLEHPEEKKAELTPFIPDPMEETLLPAPERHRASFHDISEIGGLSKQPSMGTLVQPEEKKAEFIYYRPGFDNVPSY